MIVINILGYSTFIQGYLRIDNSGWSVNSAALFDIAVMKWYQKKYYVLYNIRKPIINSIH